MSTSIAQAANACTRCGLCLQACPTYRDLRLEADSPRGRVFAIKQVIDGCARPDAALAEHLYACLGCRACETACPSGVPFGALLAHGRQAVERAGTIDSRRILWRAFRAAAFEWILPNRTLFAAAMTPARLLQRQPRLSNALRKLPLPARVRRLMAMLPTDGQGRANVPRRAAAEGERRARAGVFLGCVMDALFGRVHEALVRVLRHNGCDVVTPSGQWCCGALNLHAGERTHARAMARRNIDAFAAVDVDAIVVDSAGCAAELKSYGELLADDPAYAQRAAAFASTVQDVSEFLVGLPARTDFHAVDARLTYQDACHLAHGQRIREQPRALLEAIPGVKLVELDGADRCCGAAGVYSLTHPEMSGRILAEKMSNIESTGADTVVVTNPGCHMQLLAGAASIGTRVRVRHLVQVLDEAYRSR